MPLSAGSHWNRPRRWPRKIRWITKCSDLSVRGLLQRGRGGQRKILRTAMIVSKERSVSGLPLRDIEKISCSAMLPASASPAQEALALIARIGQWRSRTILNRCGELQARQRRLRQNENHLHSL